MIASTEPVHKMMTMRTMMYGGDTSGLLPSFISHNSSLFAYEHQGEYGIGQCLSHFSLHPAISFISGQKRRRLTFTNSQTGRELLSDMTDILRAPDRHLGTQATAVERFTLTTKLSNFTLSPVAVAECRSLILRHAVLQCCQHQEHHHQV